MKNIRKWKQTCPAPPAQMSDELQRHFVFLFFLFLLISWWTSSSLWDQTNYSLSFFSFLLSISLSPHLWFLTLPLWPAIINADRDRHMQGGRQPCSTAGSTPWQQISTRGDNWTRSENNAVCQPRNSACHSRDHSPCWEYSISWSELGRLISNVTVFIPRTNPPL